MITRIQAAALKGRTFSQALHPITVVAGPNDTGKTALPDAIKLAALGHIPGHPKTGKAIFALASASNMSVTAEFSNGAVVTRSWTAKGKSVTATEQGVDGLPAFPLAMLDADAYFGASDQARVAMVFGLVDLAKMGFTAKALTAELRPPEEPNLPALDKVLSKLPPPPAPDVPLSPQAWIDHVLEGLEEEVKSLTAEIQRMEKTGQGLASLGQNEALVDGAALAREIDAATRQKEVLERRVGELEGAIKSAGQDHLAGLRETVATLSQRLAGLDTSPRDSAALAVDLAEARKKLTGLQQGLASAEADIYRKSELAKERAEIEVNLSALPPATAADHQKAERDLEAQVAAFVEPPDHAEALKAAAEDLTRLRAEYKSLEQQRTAAAAKWQALAGARCCPTCGTAGADFSEAIVTLENEELTALDGQLRAIEQQGNAARTAHAKVEKQAAEAATIRNQQAATKQRLASIRKMLLDGAEVTARRAALERTRDGIDRQLAVPLETPIEALRDAHRTAQAQVDQLQQQVEVARDVQQLKEAQAAIQGAPKVDLPGLQQELAAVRQKAAEWFQQLEQLRTKEKQAIAQAADRRRVVQAIEEREKKGAIRDQLKAKVKLLKEKREALVLAAFKPLLETANRFVAGILPSPLEYREGEIGRFSGSSWVSVRAFGGCFGAVTFAGIQAALSAQAGLRLVIVDELGRFDDGSLTRFLENVRAAISQGVLEQFLGIDVNPGRYVDPHGVVHDGLHLIRTERK